MSRFEPWWRGNPAPAATVDKMLDTILRQRRELARLRRELRSYIHDQYDGTSELKAHLKKVRS